MLAEASYLHPPVARCRHLIEATERKQRFRKIPITYCHFCSNVAHFVRHLGLTELQTHRPHLSDRNTGTKQDCDYLDPLKHPLKPIWIDALMALMINVCPSSASRLRPKDEPWAWESRASHPINHTQHVQIQALADW